MKGCFFPGCQNNTDEDKGACPLSLQFSQANWSLDVNWPYHVVVVIGHTHQRNSQPDGETDPSSMVKEIRDKHKATTDGSKRPICPVVVCL